MSTKSKGQVFITGASGFVGANLTRALIKKNYATHILTKSKIFPWRLQGLENKISNHIGDITDFSSVKKTLTSVKPDYIIHLAVYGAYHFQTELDKIVNVNIVGVRNLLDASRDIPYKCFINTGSSSEYGIKNAPMKENDFCDPISYYAATKLGATHIGKVFALMNNKPVVTFRLFSVYGPYEAPTRLVPVMMKSLITRQTINLSPGKQRRDFIYVEDVCDAYLKALTVGKKITGEILNIGTGREYTNEEVVKALFAVTGQKTKIAKGAYPKRPWEALHWKASISHTKELLGWTPKVTLDKGLQGTYSWFEKNVHLYQ